MKQEELNKILELHRKWLNNEKCGVKADLSGVDLTIADLTRANLRYANLCGANLCVANLKGADLRDANLSGADLRYANLCGADLCGANLCGANLKGADLRDADLYSANLRDADLYSANLRRADLRDADLSGADLRGANLYDANLYDANLYDANLCGAVMTGSDLRGANITNVKYNETTSFVALQCPEEGSFIAYKKVNDIIIKLEVPADAKRSSATTRKCRCSKAKVLGFYDLNRNELNMEEVINYDYSKTVYRKGEMVYPDSWDEDRWNECSHGIHFFVTFEEAKNY